MVDAEEPCSIEHLHSRDAFPGKPLVRDEEGLQLSFTVLPGENALYLGRSAEGVIALSNFRLFVKLKDSFINVPLGLIEVIECRDIFYLYVLCKDARSLKCSFTTNEACLEWFRRLNQTLYTPTKLEDVFACAFFAWCMDPSLQEAGFDDVRYQDTKCLYRLGDEMDRMGFRYKSGEAWRVYNQNEQYNICPSYPKEHIIPAWITDDEMEKTAAYRSSKRFPSVVWRYQKNGAVIARSSQPEVGWLGWRCKEDETLVRAIVQACNLDQKSDAQESVLQRVRRSSKDNKKKLLIIDARSYTAALANRAKGGGMECQEYYTECEIIFMNLANIHTIRKSFQSVRNMCTSVVDQCSWLSLLEGTKWLHHIVALMKAAAHVVTAVDKDERPVLVHCSDGWDRTPQIVALAELMLDPYYRTTQGFQVLVEREWLAFGHKFGDRCGHGVGSEDTSERCPVFLQWLDCVHHLLYQFPCAFEFNEMFLVKLAQHVYSCLFGTFLCNTIRERDNNEVASRTLSVWTLLNAHVTRFKNCLYNRDQKDVLRPSVQLRNYKLWSSLYLSSTTSVSGDDQLPEEVESLQQSEALNLPPKTRSCDDIIAALENENAGLLTRRLSDPTICIDGLEPHHLINVQAKGSPVITDQWNNTDNASSDCKVEVMTAIHLASQCGADNNVESIELQAIQNETDGSSGNTNIVKGKQDRVETNGPDNGACNGQLEYSHTLCNGSLSNGDTNGHGDSDGDTEDAEVPSSLLKTPTPSKTSLLEYGCRSVDTSTDTLVEDIGNLGHNSRPASGRLTQPCDKSSNAKHAVVASKELGRLSSVSTSTSDLSDSHVSVNTFLRGCKKATLDDVMLSLHATIPEREGKCVNSTTNGSSMSSKTSTTSSLDSGGHSCPPTPGSSADFKDCNPFLKSNSRVNRHLDVDGLTLTPDPVQQRLLRIEEDHAKQVTALQRQVKAAKLALYRYTSGNNELFVDGDELNSFPECLDGQDHHSVNSNNGSELSWDTVDQDDRPTLWVPDHLVTHCGGCQGKFWIAKRRHHCRNCGQVFCSTCTDNFIPIPQQQLSAPSRVCVQCYNSLSQDDTGNDVSKREELCTAQTPVVVCTTASG